MIPNWIHFHCATTGTPYVSWFLNGGNHFLKTALNTAVSQIHLICGTDGAYGLRQLPLWRLSCPGVSVSQWAKDPELSLLCWWLRSLLWHGFNPWPGDSHMPQACPPSPPKEFHALIFSSPPHGYTLSRWKFPNQGLNLSWSCDNTGSFNPLCQAGNWTHASTVTQATAIVTVSVGFFFSSLGPRIEVPRLQVKSELQLLTCATAVATWDLSQTSDLSHSLRQQPDT